MNRTVGVVLLVIGIAMLIWTGFTYTKKEKVIDAGPLQVSAEKEHTVAWPPYAGGRAGNCRDCDNGYCQKNQLAIKLTVAIEKQCFRLPVVY